jgi:hypothetical protein
VVVGARRPRFNKFPASLFSRGVVGADQKGHGAMAGTNFKKNQKSKTPYLVHYKLGYLEG